MSYKKYTRTHGRTARVFKYKWSTGDKYKKFRSRDRRHAIEWGNHGRTRPETFWISCDQRPVQIQVWPCGKIAIRTLTNQTHGNTWYYRL